MTRTEEAVAAYRARGWCMVPVHRPDLDRGTCSCGRPDCPKPGKHPDARFWPAGSADTEHFAGRNVGVKLGPDSAGLADVDLDCGEAVSVGPYLLPPTGSAFGRGGEITHRLYAATDRTAAFAKLLDPVRSGDEATIVELRWPEWDEAEGRFKNVQTVFPPSLHVSGEALGWARDEAPAGVAGAELNAAVRHVGAAVLIARYARPQERHALVLLVANLVARAGWADDARAVALIAAVFAARNDADKVAKVAAGEGAGAVADARKRLKAGKPMSGLPALRAMLDPALDGRTAVAVVARVKEWLGVPDPPAAHATVSAGPGGGAPGAAGVPLYTPLPPWRPFPAEHLPDPVRAFVATVAAAMRCDPTYVALPALATCAGMIGATRVIRLKKSWHEPAMLWAAVVGDSGTLKTPPYKRAVAPVVAMQAAHLQAHRAAAEAHRAEAREYERLKRRSTGDDPGDPPEPPACPRIYSRDTTVEALAGLLVDNRTRFLIGRDELSGWLSSFNQYKAKGGSDTANWLELHGLGTLCVDRKTGDPKTIFVPDVGVSLCGGIQPGVLRLALTPQHFSAGVPARLLFAYPPKRPKEWTEDDIDEPAETAYHRLVRALAELEPGTDADGAPCPVPLALAPDAKPEWVRFYARFADRQAEADGELAAAFSKLEGYAARLALVHHVCRSVAAGTAAREPVTVDSVRAGIALAEWFTSEAERVYQMLAEEAGEHETRKLIETVTRLAARHGGRVTVPQFQRSNQRRYRTARAAEEALDGLVALGLGRWEPGPTTDRGGRPSRAFVPAAPGCDGTASGVTEPANRASAAPAATTAPDQSYPGKAPGAGEVSYVSSHVTHGHGAPGPAAGPSDAAGAPDDGPSRADGPYVTCDETHETAAPVERGTEPLGAAPRSDNVPTVGPCGSGTRTAANVGTRSPRAGSDVLTDGAGDASYVSPHVTHEVRPGAEGHQAAPAGGTGEPHTQRAPGCSRPARDRSPDVAPGRAGGAAPDRYPNGRAVAPVDRDRPGGSPAGPAGTGASSRDDGPRVTCDETYETSPPVDRGTAPAPAPACDGTADGGAVRLDRPGHTPDATAAPATTSDDQPVRPGEVSYVPSHVTPESGDRCRPAPGAECSPRGFVTRGPVSSHVTPDGRGPQLVSDVAGLEQLTAVVRAAERVGLDLETTGLDHARDRVRLLSLATPSGTFLVDLFALPDPAAALAPLLEAQTAVEVVGQNLGFDLPFLMRLGFVPGRVRDTMLASQVLHAGNRTVGHSLQELVRRHLGLELDKELQAADWSGPLTDAHLEYAARDAELPLGLWEKLAPELAAANLTGTAETELAALPAVAWAARCGVALDRPAWEAVAADTEACAARAREHLDERLPNPGNLFGVTNWNSVDEVTAAFAAAGVALASTGDDALAAVGHPAAALLREYRAASKLAGTYGRAWLRHVSGDGRVYAAWKQVGAGASGRMSCKDPNLQQLPRDPRFRRCFVAPPGRALVKADYSQIELRIAAKITGDRRMLEAYRTGEDLHTTTARTVLGKSDVSKADRQLAKSLNFGLLYGMGARALAGYAAANFGVELTAAEAARHRDAFFRTYPGLRAWHRRVPDGTIQTRTLGGRRRVGVSAFTEKLNTPVQGTGADGLKRALALLWERRAACPDAFPVLLVHDEIVVECAEDRLEKAAAWVRDAMRDGIAPLLDPVPVEVEVIAGRTWAG
ncbi:DNA polymerase [Gemmata sp. JC673]|uniref:DNA polymerase I n=1 Tax=Gemmata algarum TaxID=2975278 RepID=A0ABU5F721_9BACT|nr:DNA polymerase [Gemmata algarum]MDY3563391.1 DNA polymerase [Gemmata algarum]